ncbi:hypothetical protein Tco_0010534 [Tanacetum coccineum]
MHPSQTMISMLVCHDRIVDTAHTEYANLQEQHPMFAESFQVVGNERCTLTLIPVGSKWSLNLLCIITCQLTAHMLILPAAQGPTAICVGSLHSPSRLIPKVSAKDLDNILEKWSDEHKKRRETGLKGEPKPDLTDVLISILEGDDKNKFKQPHGKLKQEIMKKYEKIPRTNATNDYLRMIEQSDEVPSSLYISHPGLRLTISPNVEVSFFTLLRTTDDVEDVIFDVYALPCFGLVLFVMALIIHAL